MIKNIINKLTRHQGRQSSAVSHLISRVVFLGIAGFGATPAFAGDCIQDQWKAAGNKQKLTCTANDVRIAEANNITDLDGNKLDTCIAGSTFSFLADFTVLLGAQERFDIGLYFATDGDENGTGDGAITGECSVNIITDKSLTAPLGSDNFIQLDESAQPDDVCGDINGANNPQIVTVQVDNVLCLDADGDGFLDLPNCTSWRQDGANEVCLSELNAFPGSPSKCNCDPDFNIPVRVESGSITVTKTASPTSLPEPGGQFTFTVNVQNDAQFTSVTLNRICDSDHGLIADVSGVGCNAGSLGSIDTTSCVLPQVLSQDDGNPGGTDEYTCSFTATINSDTPVPNEQDTVEVCGLDARNEVVCASDTASIAITDVPPAAMVTKALKQLNCVNVTYDVDVKNTSTVESLDLTALTDSSFGDITQVQGSVTETTCGVPQTIGSGNTYSCSFKADFCGASHTNKVTATLNDDDDQQTSVIMPMSDSVTVEVTATQQN